MRLQIPDEVLQIPHDATGRLNEVDYRLGWSRTYLKKAGLIDNSSRGVWTLIKNDLNLDEINISDIVSRVRDLSRVQTSENKSTSDFSEDLSLNELENEEDWKDKLLNKLYSISPNAFERLTQRILRESGFFHVEVTGRSGDGGIDGKGIVRVSGILSFHVIFQCKRYKGTVSSSSIRDFRGAMQGRADKGLFITTGFFSKDAVKEATRDGAPPIDLIDGDMLCEKLKELKLGVKTEIKEVVMVDEGWFDEFLD